MSETKTMNWYSIPIEYVSTFNNKKTKKTSYIIAWSEKREDSFFLPSLVLIKGKAFFGIVDDSEFTIKFREKTYKGVDFLAKLAQKHTISTCDKAPYQTAEVADVDEIPF